jgi:hypothetical protein
MKLKNSLQLLPISNLIFAVLGISLMLAFTADATVLRADRSPAEIQSGWAPDWFMRDVQRKAQWLPEIVRHSGVNFAFQSRWSSLPQDIQGVLDEMAIPSWQIALIPTAENQQAEIFKQLRFMSHLSGPPASSPLAQRAEQLLIFGGSAQLPTPGDAQTGASLGAEGCTAAMARYVLAQLKIEFPNRLATLPDRLADSQSSEQMKVIFEQLARQQTSWMNLKVRAFSELHVDDVHPGSLMIGQKPGGTHVFGWTRVPTGWRWSAGDKMAVGNTGLEQFGDRMILAQEYLTDAPSEADEMSHNEHGPLNSHNVVYASDGEPDLSNPRTNVYAAQGSDFIIIDFK